MHREVSIGLPDRELLRPDEVARLLGVSTKTVYRWCDMGLLESCKLNKSVRVLRSSLFEFLTKGFNNI
jgi:excisionase family DNA binding protein